MGLDLRAAGIAVNDVSPSAGEALAAREAARDIFVRRWCEGDRSCSPQGFDVLVTNPYPGLRSFSRELRPYFFGREKQKDDLRRYFSDPEPGRAGVVNRITFVVGGSGSGKSSLTRAGLLAEIHGITLQGRRGAWYIAEMRPEKDPVGHLLKSLRKVLHNHFVELAFKRSAEPDADELKNRLRKAAADCGLAWGPDDDLETVGRSLSQWLDPRIWPQSQQDPRRIDTAEVFRFVDKVLYAFDTAASFGERAGPPRLLLHIDQFEEVFRDECDAAGRSALIGLLLDVHEFRPDHLFVVATMRSEELHRFSEHAGMAEVINSSMYLVDLIADDDIESAIADGAARLASYWELPVRKAAAAPFTQEAVEALANAFDEAGRVASHTADRLPLLQHLLPLVWEQAVDDWVGRYETHPDAILEIDSSHLNAVPGWLGEPAGSSEARSNDSRLGRCLNARADQVWQDALAELDDDGQAEGILRVALCSLAQLDDQGRAVRRFASLDQMLGAAGGTGHDALRPKLQAALEKFVVATLLERRSGEAGRPDNYDVSHESLIRNWKNYRSWLEAERELKKRLYEIERSVDDLPDAGGYNWRSRFLGREKADAFAKISSEGVDDLALVFQDPQPLYSKEWAVDALLQEYKADSARRIPMREELGKRVEKIRGTWLLAKEWKDRGRRQQERREKRVVWGLLAFGAVVAAGAILSWKLGEQNKQLAELKQQLQIALAANDALNGQSITHDRYLHKIVESVEAYKPRSDLDAEQAGVLRQTASNLDGGIRRKYGADLMQTAMVPEASSLSEAAQCIRADPNRREFVKFESGRPSLGWADPQDEQKYSTFPNLTSGWMCVSPDGRWLLAVDHSGLPTGMSRMIRQNGDIPDVLPVRTAGSDESRTFASGWYRDSIGMASRAGIPDGAPAVTYFSGEGFAGFQASSGDRDDVSVWTQTGLLDPDDAAPPPDDLDWQQCDPSEWDSADGKFRVCIIDKIALDRLDKYLAIIMPARDNPRCIKATRCLATIKIQYANPNSFGPDIDRDVIRANIPFSWAEIEFVAIKGDWLWLKDVNKRTWRYTVGAAPVMNMLERRWQHTEPLSRLVPESCKNIEGCEHFLLEQDDGWVGLSRPAAEATK